MSNSKAANDFKARSGNPLGKFPSLKDGDMTVYERGARTEYFSPSLSFPCFLPSPHFFCRLSTYLRATYDKQCNLSPSPTTERIKALHWHHAAEATFMLHVLAITYAREL
ncbi:hypothetical protein PMIN03_007124 [Paraphaeosphaeria minitans]|uniref:GST N-terminal domain-containing protein n=1 Tax=Paraphaeosphaeria minitans TaxID=565426 RepID=A0A9P6GID2_9PLEO|nr:hypothetical protein PMIN01_06395 [Paraphaeosphaeria minitans]